MRRRRFLKRALSLAASGVAAGNLLYGAEQRGKKARVGSQLYGWGQYYSRDGRKSWEHTPEILSALRDAGYDYAEGSVDTQRPEENALFADQLRSKGLEPVSLYSGGRLHEDGSAQRAVEQLVEASKVCRKAGFRIINCNPDPIGRDKTDAELKRQVESLRVLGVELNKIDVLLGIHNHTPEMRNGAREFHSNLRDTPASHVGFCYDVHWVYRGGISSDEALKLYGNRIVSWHLRQSRGGIWWEDLTEGDLDYPAIARVVAKRKLAPLYTVELAIEDQTKITRGVVDNHRRSRDYIRRVFGC